VQLVLFSSIYLLLHACAPKFDVTENLEKFLVLGGQLNKALEFLKHPLMCSTKSIDLWISWICSMMNMHGFRSVRLGKINMELSFLNLEVLKMFQTSP